MQHHTLKRNTPRKTSAQIGRGGSRGKTSGRGTKGQKARSGHKIRPEMRDMIKKLPKLRGRGKQGLKTIQKPYVVVQVALLEKHFAAGDVVNPESLNNKGIVGKKGGKFQPIKILGKGNVSLAFTISGVSMSDGAKKSILEAGGKISE